MGRKKAGIILGAIAVAATVAAGIWYSYGNQGKDSNDRVYVEKVSTVIGNITGVQNRFSGVVQPQEMVEINADPERTVKEVFVETGDAVVEGTPLFAYDTENLNLDLAKAKLELENQDVEIANYRRQIQDLEKERAAAAEGDKFEYTTQIQTIETQIKQAEFAKSGKQLEMDKLQKKMDNSQVASTASGIIKTINSGTSQAQESSAFITILSTGEYRIKGTANEMGLINPGTNVIVRSRVDENVTWSGTVESMDTERSDSSQEDNMAGGVEEGEGASTYSFYVTLEEAEGLMLGQHVLIEPDEGQTEEKEGIWLFSGYIVFEQAEGEAASSESTEAFGETEIMGGTESVDSMMPEDSMDLMPETEDGTDLDEDAADLTEGADGIQARMMAAQAAEGGMVSEGDMPLDSEPAADDGMLSDSEPAADDGMLSDSEMMADDGMLSDEGMMPEAGFSGMPADGTQLAFVWADNGKGRLEKRKVELGEYDMELDKYEILSGLSEDDLIAWPMDGLYEGVKTVTNAEEVDYTSGLYDQETGTEGALDGENPDGSMDGMYPDSGNFDSGNFDSENFDSENFDSESFDSESFDSENPDGAASGNENPDDGEDGIDGFENRDDDKKLDLEDFLQAGGMR